jgi:hypothetical protein
MENLFEILKQYFNFMLENSINEHVKELNSKIKHKIKSQLSENKY